MLGPRGVTDSAYAGPSPAWRTHEPAETAAIGLIEQHPLVRSLSPELMLVDPELAARARELLREPDEAGGKGGYMSALGTHEISSGMSLGLEPPLSPPVVRSPMASAMPTGDGLAGLPTPPPAIRPPESATPPPAPAVHAEVPQQPEPAPAPVQPEPVLPAVAPAQEPEAPVLDYFAAETPVAPEPPAAAPAPVEEPLPTVELHTIPPIAPAPAPAEEPEPVGLPTMASPAPAPEPQPEPAPAPVVAPVELPLMAPQPLENAAPAPEPEPAAAPEPVEPSFPELEPAAVVETAPAPVPAPELEELFAPALQQQSAFSVVVRLRDGDGVEVGSFRDFGTAMEGAQEVIEQFSTAAGGQWPFYAGRFIRPDLIVSVDVVEADAV
jgi:hypothetical protein